MGMKNDANGRLTPVPGYLTEQIHAMLTIHADDNLPKVEVSLIIYQIYSGAAIIQQLQITHLFFALRLKASRMFGCVSFWGGVWLFR